MLKCLIAFALGFLVARMMRGDGLSVGGRTSCPTGQDDECGCIKWDDSVYEGECRNKFCKCDSGDDAYPK